MPMPRTERWTLKSPESGEIIAKFLVEAESLETAPPAPAAVASVPQTTSSSNGDRMTDPQKRYLFRLLAAQGVEGKKAEEHLKTHFKVSHLTDIDRQAASAYIDQLVKDRN